MAYLNSNLGSLGLNLQYGALWDAVSGKYTYDFLNACYKVYQRSNLSKSWLNYLPFVASYSYSDCQDVINSYNNLAEVGAVPEWNTGQNQIIIDEVAKVSGRSPEIVVIMLNTLEELTLEGEIGTYQFLRPATWKETAQERNYPAATNKGWRTSATETIDDAINYISWGAAAFGVTFAAIFIINAMNERKNN